MALFRFLESCLYFFFFSVYVCVWVCVCEMSPYVKYLEQCFIQVKALHVFVIITLLLFTSIILVVLLSHSRAEAKYYSSLCHPTLAQFLGHSRSP